MSRICEKCGRGALKSATRSHSNIKTKRRQMINLQWRRIDGAKKRLCTRCIKTFAKATTA